MNQFDTIKQGLIERSNAVTNFLRKSREFDNEMWEVIKKKENEYKGGKFVLKKNLTAYAKSMIIKMLDEYGEIVPKGDVIKLDQLPPIFLRKNSVLGLPYTTCRKDISESDIIRWCYDLSVWSPDGSTWYSFSTENSSFEGAD